jgi:hypothetical protein
MEMAENDNQIQIEAEEIENERFSGLISPNENLSRQISSSREEGNLAIEESAGNSLDPIEIDDDEDLLDQSFVEPEPSLGFFQPHPSLMLPYDDLFILCKKNNTKSNNGNILIQIFQWNSESTPKSFLKRAEFSPDEEYDETTELLSAAIVIDFSIGLYPFVETIVFHFLYFLIYSKLPFFLLRKFDHRRKQFIYSLGCLDIIAIKEDFSASKQIVSTNYFQKLKNFQIPSDNFVVQGQWWLI